MSDYVIKISKKPGYLNWQYEAGDLDGYMLRSGNDAFTVTKDIKYATKFNKSEAEQLINSPHYKTPTYKYYKFDIIEYTENSKYTKLFTRLDILKSRIRNFSKTDEEYEKEFIDLINTSDYTEFVEDLKVSAKDHKVRNLIDHMMTIGDRMYSRRNVIAVNKLIPTQNEIDVTKSLSYPLTHLDSCQKYFETKPIVIKLPLVTYDTKYIIDGHHRWSQVYCMNPQAKMDCFDLLTKHLKPIDVLRVIQLKIAADTGDVKVAKVEGQNLLTIDAKKLSKYIDETMIPEVDEYLRSQYKVSSREDVINKILDNVKEMRKTSQPIKDAPERGVMPQTDAIPDLENEVKKGKVTREYKEP